MTQMMIGRRRLLSLTAAGVSVAAMGGSLDSLRWYTGEALSSLCEQPVRLQWACCRFLIPHYSKHTLEDFP